MNINDYVRFNTKEMSDMVDKSLAGTGKFEWIYKNIRNKNLTIITNDGNVVGLEYRDPSITTLEADRKAQLEFHSRYESKPLLLLAYIELAVMALAQNRNLDNMEENENEVVIYDVNDHMNDLILDKNTLHIHTLGESEVRDDDEDEDLPCNCYEDCDECSCGETDEDLEHYGASAPEYEVVEEDEETHLPKKIIIKTICDDLTARDIKSLLRIKYNRCFARGSTPSYTKVSHAIANDDGYIKWIVDDIKWSNRKAF